MKQPYRSILVLGVAAIFLLHQSWGADIGVIWQARVIAAIVGVFAVAAIWHITRPSNRP